jgi:hypothetical protein
MTTAIFFLFVVPAALVILGSLEMVWALMRAPEGYQDHGGFHYSRGSQPRCEGFTETPWTPGLTT